MRVRVVVLSLLMLLLGAPAVAAAKADSVTSFDGTRIVLNWFPAKDGVKAPTVLFGPGWASPGDKNPEGGVDRSTGIIGPGALRKQGYNVLTWDPRGFGDSGGQVTVDGPDFEGRDVRALIDYVAEQPEAQLDGAGDPRLGMTGGSYGGGIQLVAAGLDPRIDAIVPDIAWHSLLSSLYKDATFKTGWGSALVAIGQVMGTLDPRIQSAYASGTATGTISAADEAFFAARGPGDLVKRIKVPTLLVQGTVDTLFTLQEAATNYELLKANGVPLKMLWFCGGHGACLSDAGDKGRVQTRTLQWLDRYLKGDTAVDTGPAFEWVDQTGKEWAASSYPPAPATPLKAEGPGGLLPIQPLGGSGPSLGGSSAVGAISGIANGTKAANAVQLTTPPQGAETLVVGAPKVTFSYSGTGTSDRLYAQLVDDTTGLVLGNLVTPVPVTLDGAEHTVTRELELVAHTLPAGRTLTLQLTPFVTAYETAQIPAGAVTIGKTRLELPTANAAQLIQAPAAAPKLRVLTARPSGRRVRVQVRATGGAVEQARVVVRDRRGRAMAARTLATLQGTRTLTFTLPRRAGVRSYATITAKAADGRTVSARRALRRR